jgi:hypothetical protein
MTNDCEVKYICLKWLTMSNLTKIKIKYVYVNFLKLAI